MIAGSDAELRRHLTDLLVAPERLETLAQRARSRYESRYSVDSMVAATERVYAAVMARG